MLSWLDTRCFVVLAAREASACDFQVPSGEQVSHVTCLLFLVPILVLIISITVVNVVVRPDKWIGGLRFETCGA